MSRKNVFSPKPLVDGESAGRAKCYRCFRPLALCYCKELPVIANRTEIVVLQHPRERSHPFNTSRIVEHALSKSRVLVDYEARFQGAAPEALPKDAALLFPSDDATPLDQVSPAGRPSTLVVLDGTWHHAKVFFREHQWLRRLPAVSLPRTQPSEYRIRKEPKFEYVSTVESVARALSLLEPETRGLDELLNALRRMVDLHLKARSNQTGRRRMKTRRRGRRVPQALFELERWVLVGSETVPVPSAPAGESALLCWAAHRLKGGDCYWAVRSGVMPSELHLRHMQISEEDLQTGTDLTHIQQSFQAFLRPMDIIVAWNQADLERYERWFSTGHDRPVVCLKELYSNAVHTGSRKGGRGTIEDAVVRHGLERLQLPLHGRLGKRLGEAAAIAGWLEDVTASSVMRTNYEV